MATNPLLAAFDNLSPAVKQSIMAAHGLAPNPLQGTQPEQLQALRPQPPATIPPPIPALTVPPIGGRTPTLADRQARVEASKNGDLGKVPPIGGDLHPTTSSNLAGVTRPPQVSNVQLPALHRALMTNPNSVAPLGPEPAATVPPIGGGDMSSLPLMRGTAPSVKAPLGTIEGDQARVAELRTQKPAFENVYGAITRSGFGQAHPTAAKILGVLGQIPATAGDVALSGVVPGYGQFIPGTSVRRAMQLGTATRAMDTDVANAQKQAETAEAQERTREMPEAMQRQMDTLRAGLAEHGLQMDDQGNITPVSEANLAPSIRAQLAGEWKPVAGAMGPNREPLEYNEKTGTYRPAPGTPGATVSKQPNDRPDTPEQQLIDAQAAVYAAKTPEDRAKAQTALDQLTGSIHAYAAATQKPERGPTFIQQTGEADKVAGRLIKPYDTEATAMRNKTERIDQTLRSVDAGYVGQGLAIPELLTSLVSGQGTGVRVTQPELNAITAHRGIKNNFEGFFNSMAGKGNLTAQDKTQIKAVLNDAKTRILVKQQMVNDAQDAINSGETRKDVVEADKKFRQISLNAEKYSEIRRDDDGNYYGSNDGGTHAFDLATGKEVK